MKNTKIYRWIKRVTEPEVTGEMKLRYVLFPPTGRTAVDYLLDTLCLLSVAFVWMMVYRQQDVEVWEAVSIGIVITLVVFIAMAGACRDITSVKTKFGKSTLSFKDKRQYATIYRFRALGSAAFSFAFLYFDHERIYLVFIIPAIVGLIELIIDIWRLKTGKTYLP